MANLTSHTDIGSLVAQHVPAAWVAEAQHQMRAAAQAPGFTPAAARESLVQRLMAQLHIREFLARLLIEIVMLWLHVDEQGQSTNTP